MVATTAEVNAGQRSVQPAVSAHILMLRICLQLLEQQHSAAMLSFIDPDRSSTRRTSVGPLRSSEVTTPQFASPVGGGPAMPPPPLGPASGNWNDVVPEPLGCEAAPPTVSGGPSQLRIDRPSKKEITAPGAQFAKTIRVIDSSSTGIPIAAVLTR
jgi:hypothetical protein